MSKSQHLEPHIKESNYIRDFVFGFGFDDGTNTSLKIVAGVGRANSSADFIILAALVGMFTAKAMAVQNYLVVKSQRAVLESEIKREETEMEVYLEQERLEIEKIYRHKDFDENLVTRITDKITSNKKVWLKTMLTEELGLNLGIVRNPIRGAFIMFGSFIIGGIMPILPYSLSKTGLLFIQYSLSIAIAISFTSFLIVAKKAKLANYQAQNK